MTEDVLFTTNKNGVGTILLNRPKALNSLSLDMLLPMLAKLKEWESDDTINLIVLKGAGSKGFCAGGDIKALYQARNNELSLQKAQRFFEVEYQLDQYMYRYSKPILACLDGIVMGGGVGLTYGCSHRIVTTQTKWSMPEMNIGFFPDVGAAYFLNQAPGKIGRYLALTAAVIRPEDVLYINGADACIPSEALHDFLHQVEETNWQHQNVAQALEKQIQAYSQPSVLKSELALWQEEIDRHFAFSSIEEIIDSLGQTPNKFTVKTKEILLSKSPFSLKVTLQQQIKGEHATLEECFRNDLILAKNFMKHSDFYEGVRSVLIDKDNSPSYQYKHLSDVNEEMVQKFFHV
ncbi:enoyl-CoA hydratase/isomerase family protein [Brevibacillus laterosporus]|uniref:enoyl-CoA hydratase/isomerase family protein n=1 Tax=Brevibacillus laterosporus TaxID=1465 RepID=UPI00036CC61B|nr:enoyl-CoA hydratase/isomerase family protein [Brevibacillus laterosporus]ATO49638.1 3-hydroxyisobutyryl-CoA hydrolase [Brevibacillus laterosporus DSM 25]MBG9801079.1 3-hydroxyisobutyryl-CoA hydrolase [Brevibacillus laterosporus]MED2003265.1 enoyl-CoA hydratase/isomerase family protein [Brevibacillus laterosporus]MED4765343.1 enoyl-CoA hydratase/isomerase family protein [Brevibacillus laterosporus]TPH11025.1 enoyl-CoA hydratase/isomerase family protein [Brevibacillus laterosporus]